MSIISLLDPGVNGSGDGGRVIRARPTKSYVATLPHLGTPEGGLVLSGWTDDVVRQRGWRVYELMRYDAAVEGALSLLKAGILADGLKLSPAVKAEPGEVVSKRKRRNELALAQEISDAATRSLDRLDRPLDEILLQLLEALPLGTAAAEQTYELAGDGPDAGRLVLRSLTVLPRWAWAFRVDRFRKVQSIRGWTEGGWADLPRDKFAVLSWDPRAGDPRGASILRSAYTPWNLKVQQWPEYGEFLHHFADPSIIATAGVDAQPTPKLDSNGQPVRDANGRPVMVDPLERLIIALTGYRNRSGVALPYGSTWSLIESKGEGGAHGTAFDRFDMEIFRAILCSPRPMQESKHGSKADSESGLDLVGMRFAQGRKPLARAIQDDVLSGFTRLNWGKDVADRLTPNVSFGQPDNVKAELINAFALAYSKGFIEDSQLPHIWDMLGLPQGDLKALSEQAAARKPMAPGANPADPNAAESPPPDGSA